VREAEASKVNQINCQLTTGAARLGTAKGNIMAGRFMNQMKKRQARKARQAKIKEENMARATDTPSPRIDIADAGTLPEITVKGKPTSYRDVRMGRATAMQYARSRFNRNKKK